MPNPTQADLHINAPLTNVSIAYMQSASAYISDRIFPRVPVRKQSDLYWKYSKSDWRRTDVNRRAPSTESPGVGWKYDTDQYYAHVYAVHKDIDDQVRANADSNFSLDKEATEFVTNQMLLKRDVDWNKKYFKKDVWATEYDSASDFLPWNDAASDPISDMAKWIIEFRKQTGFAPNKMVLGANVMAALKQHPDIIDRIKYTQKGIVSEDLIATLFDVSSLYTSYATWTEVPQMADVREQDKNADFQFITPTNDALLLYSPPAPGLQTPAAGYTFTWSGYLAGNSQGIRIKRFRMEPIASDRIEAEMTYDMKVVCPDMGIHISNAVTDTP